MKANKITLKLDIQYEHDGKGSPPRERLVRTTLQAALDTPAQLAIRFVTAAESRRLNLRHLGKDRPANVLAFAYPDPESLLGDIVICPTVVEQEASAQGIACADRYAHMLVHAALHLQGMDHDTNRAAEAMENTEREILAALGLPDPYPA